MNDGREIEGRAIERNMWRQERKERERGREGINEEGYCLPTYTRPKIKSVCQNESESETERKEERETIVAAPDIESS